MIGGPCLARADSAHSLLLCWLLVIDVTQLPQHAESVTHPPELSRDSVTHPSELPRDIDHYTQRLTTGGHDNTPTSNVVIDLTHSLDKIQKN